MAYQLDKDLMSRRAQYHDALVKSNKAKKKADTLLKSLRDNCDHELVAEASKKLSTADKLTRVCEICGLVEHQECGQFDYLINSRVRILESTDQLIEIANMQNVIQL